jgi:hypothetical protein
VRTVGTETVTGVGVYRVTATVTNPNYIYTGTTLSRRCS